MILDGDDVATLEQSDRQVRARLARVEKERDDLLAALEYHQEQTRPIQQTIDIITRVRMI